MGKLIQKGALAPDFRLTLLEGGEAGLADLTAGGQVLLAFFKISCPVCQLTLPYLGGVRTYGVSQNDAEDTRDFKEHFRLSFPILLDPQRRGFPASNAYGISSVPTLFLIEPDGKVSRVIEGWRKKEMTALGARVPDNVPEWKAG